MTLEHSGEALVVECPTEWQTEHLGQALARQIRPGLVIGLVGELGAGKTRLVRAIAEALGADPHAIASPTFVLIHEYDSSPPIYHFDAYRLKSGDELDALGADEYFAGDGVCLVEWADRVANRLPSNAWWIHADRLPQGRVFRLHLNAAAAENVARDLAPSSDSPRKSNP